MSSNIVAEWLLSLHLGQYAESFLDNGYDDLEICKQVGEPDLDAIGVLHPIHRTRLLDSVRRLREEGAASVYFTLEEAAAIVPGECVSGKDIVAVDVVSVDAVIEVPPTPPTSTIVTTGSSKYADEYEEGKAELVRIPKLQLKTLLREQLDHDGIQLACQPYSTTDGERGYLEGLASRYADLFSTHYGDVLGHLEDLRRREWAEASPRDRGAKTPSTPPGNFGTNPGTPTSGITSSQSQPIYVPGKYSPSSCLSDKEEDEIYGFGYGVFGAQIARQQQQRLMGSTAGTQPLLVPQINYQTCLSPRSAYFYEFPPNDQNYSNTSKKKTTFSRFLRGLKTSHRKEKHGNSSPRHGRAAARGVPQRVDTPDSVLQSGLALTDLGQHAVLRSMVDPRDYDRLRHLQLNGAPNTFEETIHRLKLQEALKKREKITKEHEEILRDIREGLLQLGKEGFRGPLSGDDTYMYDEDARVLAPMARDRGHWYDEPPYESDPEDFLMGAGGSGANATASIQNGRVCFTLNQRPEGRGEGVISLRSAGDISLPRDGSSNIPRAAPRRGLILPQAGHPPTIIPLTHSRIRESGDYAASDIQSISSRLSTLSVDTNRSDHPDFPQRQYRKGNVYRNEDMISPSQSSDYEDQDDFDSQQIATVHMTSDGNSTGVCNLMGKVRGLRQDVQRKISKQHGETLEQEKRNEQAFPCSASSIESLPSGSGSSTQALVRAGSNHSSISVEDVDSSPADPQIIGRAKALVDCNSSPYDKDALKFKKGDIIDILSMNASGQWKGISNGKRGTFKFINVELLSERSIRPKKDNKWQRNIKNKPVSVEDLLRKINMQEHISVFVLNGYEDLELFKEIEPSDLDYLGIISSEHRAKILTAVQLLHDLDCSEGDIVESSSEGDDPNKCQGNVGGACSPFERRQFLRDSGCYDASLKSSQQTHHTSPQDESDASDNNGFFDTTNNLDSVVEQCNNEILARVRQAQKNALNLKEDASYQANITNSSSTDKIQKTKDSYVGIHGQTTLIDPCRRNLLGGRSSYRKTNLNIEDTCEADQKLSSVKFVVGTGNSEISLGETTHPNSTGRGGCLSEKSSDSGVSSSSVSSGNVKEIRPPQSEAFIRGMNTFSASNRTTMSNTAK